MRQPTCLVLGILLFIFTGSLNGAELIGLGDLPGGDFISYGYAVSADGLVVVGVSHSAPNTPQAFRWTQTEGMVGLVGLDGQSVSTEAFTANGDGSVIGGGSPSTDGRRGVLWSGSMTPMSVGELAGGLQQSEVQGLSDSGAVAVGYSSSSIGPEAFRWTESDGIQGLGTLGGLNDQSVAYGVSSSGSTIVGEASSPNGVEAFRWTESGGMVGLGFLPGGTESSRAYAASADGAVIVGQSKSALGFGNYEEAFIWTQATGMVGLGDLPGGPFQSVAYGVSADGSVVVGTSLGGAPNVPKAFVWTKSAGMRSLESILVEQGVDIGGWSLDVARGVSEDGMTIVGYGINPTGDVEGWLAVLNPVPEPGSRSVAALVLGLLALVRDKSPHRLERCCDDSERRLQGGYSVRWKAASTAKPCRSSL